MARSDIEHIRRCEEAQSLIVIICETLVDQEFFAAVNSSSHAQLLGMKATFFSKDNDVFSSLLSRNCALAWNVFGVAKAGPAATTFLIIAFWVAIRGARRSGRRRFRRQAGVPDFLFFFGGRFFQRSGNAKANELGVGQIPDALRNLRVLLLPVFVGAAAGGAAQSHWRRRPRNRPGRRADTWRW